MPAGTDAAVPEAITRPRRLLIVCPSWLGDCVMATPALRRLRQGMPGALLGALVRPGMDELFEGSGLFDQVHVARSTGIMGPKHAAAKVRPDRYDAAVLLSNSFSTALIARLAWIPRRIGYARDARSLLLTDAIAPALRPDGRYAIVPAVTYYLRLADHLLGRPHDAEDLGEALCLGLSTKQQQASDDLLARAGLSPQTPRAILNPGGNNPAKRWPADRFAALARHLHEDRGLRVLVNGSPGERALITEIIELAGVPCVSLPDLGVTIGSLKGVVRGSRLMVSNDTGPRHIAAAFGVPLVSLFGPTDARWTTIPTRPTPRGRPGEQILRADESLDPAESANDHPERCRIDRISVDRVLQAVDEAL